MASVTQERKLILPRVPVYSAQPVSSAEPAEVSVQPTAVHTQVPALVPTKQTHALNTPMGKRHYRVLLLSTEHSSFDYSLLTNCRGRKSCYFCDAPVQGRPYFYPVRREPTGIFVCMPYIHCSPEHSFATVKILGVHNARLVQLHFDMYGPTKRVPPRSLYSRYLPSGGLTPEQVQELEQAGTRVEVDRPGVCSTLMPLMVSVTDLLHPTTQVPEPEILQFVDALHETHEAIVKPDRNVSATSSAMGNHTQTQVSGTLSDAQLYNDRRQLPATQPWPLAQQFVARHLP